MDNRIKKHAEVLLKYSLDLKKGEKIVIVGDVVTLPLIEEQFIWLSEGLSLNL